MEMVSNRDDLAYDLRVRLLRIISTSPRLFFLVLFSYYPHLFLILRVSDIVVLRRRAASGGCA